jgi:hypothetical protein
LARHPLHHSQYRDQLEAFIEGTFVAAFSNQLLRVANIETDLDPSLHRQILAQLYLGRTDSTAGAVLSAPYLILDSLEDLRSLSYALLMIATLESLLGISIVTISEGQAGYVLNTEHAIIRFYYNKSGYSLISFYEDVSLMSSHSLRLSLRVHCRCPFSSTSVASHLLKSHITCSQTLPFLLIL